MTGYVIKMRGGPIRLCWGCQQTIKHEKAEEAEIQFCDWCQRELTMTGKPIDLLNELIPLRDLTKELAQAASVNNEERTLELWRLVAYHFERLDIRLRPQLARMAGQRSSQ